MSSTLNCSAIYGIINQQNGKIYVGSALNVRLRVRHHFNRLRANEHISKHLQRAFNQYGEGAFKIVILERVDDPSYLIPREQYYLDLLRPIGSHGYNTCPTAGSTFGVKRPAFSDEWRRKMSDAHKGEKNHFFGRTHSEEARQVISAKTKQRMADPSNNYFYGKRFTGEENYMFGRTHSSESRAKIGAASKGRKHTDENRRLMSLTRKGRPLVKNRKAVVQIDMDGCEVARFDCVTEAASSLKCSITAISTVLRGKGKTAKGFQWRYAE